MVSKHAETHDYFSHIHEVVLSIMIPIEYANIGALVFGFFVFLFKFRTLRHLNSGKKT